MDVHQNARLTWSCRELLVARVRAGRPQAQVARELGVSVKTVGKWLRRYREQGRDGSRDRGSRPHRSPAATPEVLRTAVVALRRQRLTVAAIAAQLGLSHHYTKPYTPRTNGKAERFIQSCLREWAYARAYHHSHQRRDALPRWLHGYNWHRPNMSLAGQPPIHRLRLNRNNLLRLHN